MYLCNKTEAEKGLIAIRTGKAKCSDSLIRCVSLILYAAEHIEVQPEICDWLRWHRNDKVFIEEITEQLNGFLRDAGIERIQGEDPNGEFGEVLDHHIWNDLIVDKWGHQPGKNILIRLYQMVGIRNTLFHDFTD